MKKVGIMCAALLLPLCAFGESLTGYDISKRAHDVESGKTAQYNAVLTLQTKKGAVRTREITLRRKQYDGVKKSLITFSAPKDVAGVAYLSFEYDSNTDAAKESESWLYMPAMKKVRRISGSSRQDDFMGSDFTYEDIGDRGLDKDDFTLAGEETVEGSDCWKVDCVAKDKSEKTPRRIVWIRKDNYLIQKVHLYNQRGEVERELICSDIKEVDGIWTICKMFMKNLQTEHTSTLELKTLNFNIDLSDNLFTVASIERGLTR